MDDEIGELIESFNQTLERLETLVSVSTETAGGREPRTAHTADGYQRQRRSDAANGRLDDESLTSINLEAGRLHAPVGGLLLLAQAESES